MYFHLDKANPRLPSMVNFQIPVSVQNINIQWCVIDEGASTCIMWKNVLQKLRSPKLKPSVITLKAYDGCPLTPASLYQNVSIFFSWKDGAHRNWSLGWSLGLQYTPWVELYVFHVSHSLLRISHYDVPPWRLHHYYRPTNAQWEASPKKKPM